MSLRKIKQKLELMTEQEIIDSGYCPDCIQEEGKVSKLVNRLGCKDCNECGFSVCG